MKVLLLSLVTQISTRRRDEAMNFRQYSKDEFDYRRIEEAARRLPEHPEDYTDIYFLRTREILRAKGWNPWIKAQVFVRRGPGRVAGIYDLLAVLGKYTPFFENGGRRLCP